MNALKILDASLLLWVLGNLVQGLLFLRVWLQISVVMNQPRCFLE